MAANAAFLVVRARINFGFAPHRWDVVTATAGGITTIRRTFDVSTHVLILRKTPNIIGKRLKTEGETVDVLRDAPPWGRIVTVTGNVNDRVGNTGRIYPHKRKKTIINERSSPGWTVCLLGCRIDVLTTTQCTIH